MRVKCVLCEKIENINDDTLQAKKLRNRPIHTYMCGECSERISDRTNERIATGKFKIYRGEKQDEGW